MGHKGAFYYIGNEDGIIVSTERWKKHAQTIKGVDPTAKTIFNYNYLNARDLETIINGGWIPGVKNKIDICKIYISTNLYASLWFELLPKVTLKRAVQM